MHYEGIRHNTNPLYLCDVLNDSLDQINGENCAEVVGTYGAVIFRQNFDFDEIKKWSNDLGYYLNDKVPPRKYDEYDTGLSLYPDNEEILLIYNNGLDPMVLSLINSANSQNDIVNWKTWDLYDDIWVTVHNPEFDPGQIKNICDAVNFSPENKKFYRPVRINAFHHYKFFPRHPFHTKCIFSPKQYMVTMKTYNQDILPDHGQMIEGISSRLFNQQYQKNVILKPGRCLILDQIITQWKIVKGQLNDLIMIPFWYKTGQRKHFNYSL